MILDAPITQNYGNQAIYCPPTENEKCAASNSVADLVNEIF
jgi:hypothetical protein